MLFPNFFLKLIYNTTNGSNYLRILGPFFMLYYIQAILATTLQATGNSKYIMTDNTISILIRSSIIFLGGVFMGIYGFLISICANISIVTFLHYIHVKKAL